MKFGPFKESIADLAETLRRLFHAPPSHPLPLGFEKPLAIQAQFLEVSATTPTLECRTVVVQPKFAMTSTLCQMPLLGTVIQHEGAWEGWKTGTKVLKLPLFFAEGHRKAVMPVLPKKALTAHVMPEPFRVSSRFNMPNFSRAVCRSTALALPIPSCHRDLDLAFSIPVGFPGQGSHGVPKALWMRYSLRLVKSTGENIRNMEILGVFYIPRKGINSMRYDKKKERLFLHLSKEAALGERVPLVLAKRRTDGKLLSCFPEES